MSGHPEELGMTYDVNWINPSPLKWSSSPPDREGWYWYTNKEDKYLQMVELRLYTGGDDIDPELCVVMEVEGTFEPIEWLHNKTGSRWAGPIPLPEPEEEND